MCCYLRAQIKLFMNVLESGIVPVIFLLHVPCLAIAQESDCRWWKKFHFSKRALLVDVGNSFKLIHTAALPTSWTGKINVDVDYILLREYLSFPSAWVRTSAVYAYKILSTTPLLSFQVSVMVLLDQYVSSLSRLECDEDRVPPCVVCTT
jgi:hypothetical protein